MPILDFLDDEFVFMEKRRIPDGFGGFVYEWYEGETFYGKAVRKRGNDLIIAQQQGAKEVYKIISVEGVLLNKEDYIKRKADNAMFQITSDSYDGTPPGTSEIKCVMVYAERVTL